MAHSRSASATADAILRVEQFAGLGAAGAVQKTFQAYLDVAAAIRVAHSGSFLADGLIRRPVSGYITADAVHSTTPIQGFTADSIFYRITSGEVTADAFLSRTFTADALIQGSSGQTLLADAIIVGLASVSNIDADVTLDTMAATLTTPELVADVSMVMMGATLLGRLTTASGSLTTDAFIA
jgi:hypothetical protein